MSFNTDHIIRQATMIDIDVIKAFVDYWLTGGGIKDKAPGASHDCFVTPMMHHKYIQIYKTFVMFDMTRLTGWAVIQKNGSLIYFLIHGEYRHRGYGSFFLRRINPQKVRVKNDQSTGDPGPFYQKNGYTKTDTMYSRIKMRQAKMGKDVPKNIDIYERIPKP